MYERQLLLFLNISCVAAGRLFLPAMNWQKLTPQQAWQKIKQYCAYQERCHNETKEKLCSFGLNKNEVDECISKLIDENFLNEERFSIQFAGGKFRIKKWGRIKIQYELKQKGISSYCIKKALAALDNSAYYNTFHKLAQQKLKTLKGEKNIYIKKKKLRDYLLIKGFETGLVYEVVNGL